MQSQLGLSIDPLLAGALDAALATTQANLVTFEHYFPHDTTEGNVYGLRKPWAEFGAGANYGWTTGFWPGIIWLAYELSSDSRFRAAGQSYVDSFAERVEKRADLEIHDIGFMYTPSCVAPWRIYGDERARKVALQAADVLMERYWPAPGIFQAWGSMEDRDLCGMTIIDSMMNMPLLYWAAQESGNRKYHEAAQGHACRLRDNFIRPDGTTFHTYWFDVETGAPRFGRTAQGAADNSCWARGQAWGIYGYALSYAYTRDAHHLEAACRLADFFLARLPADRVPYWDLIYGDGSDEPRDSSAGAIAACGLLEMVRWLDDAPKVAAYRAAAEAMVGGLVQHCAPKSSDGSNALLLHGVADKPGGVGVDEASLWGDYYYLEALVRLTRPQWACYW
jgi:unsaturated chondroitin disaccharide hydrolase